MKTFVRSAVPLIAVGLSLAFGAGCAAFRQSVQDVDPDKAKPFDAKYDYSDKLKMSDEMVDKLLASEFVKSMKAAPIVAIFSVENRTAVHIDTQTITDTMRRKIMESGKMKFVNTARRDDLLKEQEYQGKHVTPETRVAISRQLGAKFMLTGSISDDTKRSGRQVRVSSKEEIFYQFTMELTDLETGLVEVAPQVQRVRQASQPLIGW